MGCSKHMKPDENFWQYLKNSFSRGVVKLIEGSHREVCHCTLGCWGEDWCQSSSEPYFGAQPPTDLTPVDENKESQTYACGHVICNKGWKRGRSWPHTAAWRSFWLFPYYFPFFFAILEEVEDGTHLRDVNQTSCLLKWTKSNRCLIRFQLSRLREISECSLSWFKIMEDRKGFWALHNDSCAFLNTK